ncbi:MAG: aminotransferase class III-fold pyridoxal phosphate-dependent enzyme, partial [Acidobacteriota bacterium]
LSGNPLAMRAGRATLEILQKNSPYERLEKLSARLEQGLDRAAAAAGVPVRINRVGSLLSIFFTDRDVGDYQTAATSDAGSFRTYFHAMLDRGIYLAPSPFEAMFVSTAHSEAEIDRTVEVAGEAFAGVARGKS